MQKILSFADEAISLDAAEMKDLSKPKCFTFILCLILVSRSKAKDNLVEMFLKKMYSINNNAKAKLEEICITNRKLSESLIDILANILTVYKENINHVTKAGRMTNKVISKHGGIEDLLTACKKVNAYKNNNHLPLLWQSYYSSRSVLFRMIDQLSLKSTSEDNSLIEALEYLMKNRNLRRDYLPAKFELRFISKKWKCLVVTKHNNEEVFSRRNFEVCVLCIFLKS